MLPRVDRRDDREPVAHSVQWQSLVTRGFVLRAKLRRLMSGSLLERTLKAHNSLCSDPESENGVQSGCYPLPCHVYAVIVTL